MIRYIANIAVLIALLAAVPALAGDDGQGAVYAMTNDVVGNAIVVYDRAPDGTLSLRSFFPTGGLGGLAASPPPPSPPIVPPPPPHTVDALGSQHPLILSDDGRFLIAVNAGSDNISVFRVHPDGLTLVDLVPSGGAFPVSLALHRSPPLLINQDKNGPTTQPGFYTTDFGGTSSAAAAFDPGYRNPSVRAGFEPFLLFSDDFESVRNLLFVLNSGDHGNITGFTLEPAGRLIPLANSTRSLGAGGTNPPNFVYSPAQVGFSPSGNELVVTIKSTPGGNANLEDPRILVYQIDANGLPSASPTTKKPNGALPFGFAFNGDHLLVAFPGSHSASSYDLLAGGHLQVISNNVDNNQMLGCWLVTSGAYAYTTNNGNDTITVYGVADDGTLTLLDDGNSASTGLAPVDPAITPDGSFLYNVNTGSGTVGMYRINKINGSLVFLGEVGGLPEGAAGIVAR